MRVQIDQTERALEELERQHSTAHVASAKDKLAAHAEVLVLFDLRIVAAAATAAAATAASSP